MTDLQLAQASALSRCKFSPGATAKRFVALMASKPASYEMSDKAAAFLDRLAHQYRKQIGTCMSVACGESCSRGPIDRDEVRVALDAVIEGRNEYASQRLVWRKAALGVYNTTHKTTFAHPYEYATKVAANNRRAHTLGDIYCRFCGERLFAQVKQPHKLVAGDERAQKHLTICALQVLAGMREAAKPGHRMLPMEEMWR